MPHTLLCETADLLSRHLKHNFPIREWGVPAGGLKVLPETVLTLATALNQLDHLLPERKTTQITGLDNHEVFEAIGRLRYVSREVKAWLGVSGVPGQSVALRYLGPLDPDVISQLDTAISVLSRPEHQADDDPDEGKRKRDPELRSWTQPELDAEIEQYKARRSSNYHELIDRVNRGDKGAKKAAKDMFSRNAIGKALRVKEGSYRMVGNSPAWHVIADALRLPRKREPVTRGKEKTGFDVAIEEKAEGNGDLVSQDVILRETIRKIEDSKLPVKMADSLKNDLILGEITADQAEEILAASIESVAEDKSNRVLPEG